MNDDPNDNDEKYDIVIVNEMSKKIKINYNDEEQLCLDVHS